MQKLGERQRVDALSAARLSMSFSATNRRQFFNGGRGVRFRRAGLQPSIIYVLDGEFMS